MTSKEKKSRKRSQQTTENHRRKGEDRMEVVIALVKDGNYSNLPNFRSKKTD